MLIVNVIYYEILVRILKYHEEMVLNLNLLNASVSVETHVD